MRLKEQKLWDRMRKNLPQDILRERVENIASNGVPDVFVKAALNVHVVPTELKAVHKLPTRDATRVFGDEGLSLEQRNWQLKYKSFNGVSLIVCAVGQGAQAYQWALLGTVWFDEFNDMSKTDLDRCAECHGSGSGFWTKLAGLIRYIR